jgi:hypothetical protein
MIDRPCRVIGSGGHVVGMVSFDCEEPGDDFSADVLVDHLMESPEPHRFLSRDTTILEAVGIVCASNETVYYVMHTNKVVGTLSYGDLFKPLGRLAFLALALEIEDQALRLCQSATNSDVCWRSLADSRKDKAIKLFKLRYARDPEIEPDNKSVLRESHHILRLIECTTLIDKARMIWNQKLIAPTTETNVLGFFHKLQTVRDQFAHPGSDGPPAELSREKFGQFINAAKSMLTSLRESMQAHENAEMAKFEAAIKAITAESPTATATGAGKS